MTVLKMPADDCPAGLVASSPKLCATRGKTSCGVCILLLIEDTKYAAVGRVRELEAAFENATGAALGNRG
jgi:hypothetical protein